MDKSSNVDSSIAEEEHIRPYNYQQHEPQNPPQRKVKYANMKDIKSFERLAEAYNQKLVESLPIVLNTSTQAQPQHFISNPIEEYFLVGQEKQQAQGTIFKTPGCWQIKLPISNIRHQSSLKVELAKMKPNHTLTIENRDIRSGRAIRFKYTLSLAQASLILRVWVQLNGGYKIWKEMEVPIAHDRVMLEFNEFNNEQTDVRVNDFLFHLVLKMPYQQESHYCIIYDDTAQIEKIELMISTQGKTNDEMDTNCSKECQLI